LNVDAFPMETPMESNYGSPCELVANLLVLFIKFYIITTLFLQKVSMDGASGLIGDR